MKAMITVRLKAGVLDPQGKAIENSLAHLGFGAASGVRQGKLIEMTLDETDPDKARGLVEEMCRKVLANPVMETFSVEIVD